MNPVSEGAPPAPERAARNPRVLLSVPQAMGLGCLGVIVVGVLFLGGLFVFITAAIRSTDAYQLAVSTAQHDPSVLAALGAPVEPGWTTTGQVDVTGAGGRANLTIPISGPRGAGTINVRADKTGGKWIFSTLAVQVEGRPTPLDLLPPAPPPSAVAP